MKQSVLLTIASVLTILLMTLHLAHDIVHGFAGGGPWNLLAIPVAVTWLYATLVLAERRSGYVIVLLASLLGAYVTVIHFKAAGGVVSGEMAKSGGAFFWVWTLLALGVCAVFSVILSAHGLWKLQWGRSRKPELESR
jgi:hypothetical protein